MEVNLENPQLCVTISGYANACGLGNRLCFDSICITSLTIALSVFHSLSPCGLHISMLKL